MQRTLFSLLAGLAILTLAGCTLSLIGTPTPYPTPFLSLPSPTLAVDTSTPVASDTPSLPSVTPTAPTATLAIPTATNAAATATTGLFPTATSGILPGSPSGPYAVILVAPGDVLNLRSAPSAASSILASFPAATTNIMRTGPSSNDGTDTWVQVQNPAGGTGWVNATYLTEYVPSATFCADGRVNTLLGSFGNAVQTSNGSLLAGSVSPAHGLTVRLWRNGNPVIFDQAHAQFVFVTTYQHDWGAAPGSGLETVGSFHVSVLPKWLDVFSNNFTLSCNSVQTGGASYDTSWPAELANLNFYSIYKPGPSGNENAWRTLLVGVDFVQGKPYVYSVTQMEWEP